MPGLTGVVVALAAGLVVATQPCSVDVQFTVVQLPDTPVVDMRKPLPPVPGADVEVAELGLKVKADSAGKAAIRLPLGPGCQTRVFTFVATAKSFPYQSVLRRIYYGPGGERLLMFLSPKEDLYADYSFKKPPKTPVTVVVLDPRGVFPVAGATVRIEELNLATRTDEYGEAEMLVPLGGPWTFDVSLGSAHARLRREVPDRGSTRFLTRVGAGEDLD